MIAEDKLTDSIYQLFSFFFLYHEAGLSVDCCGLQRNAYDERFGEADSGITLVASGDSVCCG